MKPTIKAFLFIPLACLLMISCVSKKQYAGLESQLELAKKDYTSCSKDLKEYMDRLNACNQENERLKGDLKASDNNLALRQEQVNDLKEQLEDLRAIRDKQLSTVDQLTELSQSSSDNIKETLSQLEGKDKYIKLLQSAKSRADSINLALAVNLKRVLKGGIEDEDVEVKVDKTVVFVNLSDKMLFQSGSSNITSRANEVLGKIATIIQSRPELEVMVEGYTDNVPIKNSCIQDNWDLSVKRATSVVRTLQKDHNVDPNRLIAAGRGEYNTLASNATAEGRSTNRRTRIIILPKLDQFYDLLNPNNIPD